MSIETAVSWPVRVFRLTTSKGWEECRGVNCDPNVASSIIQACPKLGCVEIRALRLRIRLINEETQEPDALVMRRQDTIYWRSSRHRGGGIVLKFRCVSECLQFSDRLTVLNPPGRAAVATETLQVQNSSATATNDEARAKKRQDMVLYMIRLLHDTDFLGFVDEMEASITSSEDGASIVAALRSKLDSSTFIRK